MRIRFYEINDALAIASAAWLAEVTPGDLVILIDYFGYPFDSRWAIQAKEKGAWVLEDACQALLSGGVGRFADFWLFSPRKFLGVPDGGVLTPKAQGSLHSVNLSPIPTDWWLKALSAAALRSEFDLHGQDRQWFRMFQEVERDRPVGRYAMSQVSAALLMCGFDYTQVAQQRIENYALLAQQLGEVALFPNLLPEVVPLGFPIRASRRDQIRAVLFRHQIYPPIHWPLADVVPAAFAASHRLSGEIMTLPCDQRYGGEQMLRMARLVRRELTE